MHEYEEFGQSQECAVGPVLIDLAYNTRCKQQRSNSEHDLFTDEEMQNFSYVVQTVLHRREYAFVFCSSEQLIRCYKLFSNHKEDEEDHYDEDPDITRTVNRHMFTVEQDPLKCLRANGNFVQRLSMLRLYHMSLVEKVVHFWQNGNPIR